VAQHGDNAGGGGGGGWMGVDSGVLGYQLLTEHSLYGQLKRICELECCCYASISV